MDYSFSWELRPFGKQQPGSIVTFPRGTFIFFFVIVANTISAAYGCSIGKTDLYYPPFQPTFILPEGFNESITSPGNLVLSEYLFFMLSGFAFCLIAKIFFFIACLGNVERW